MAILTPLADEFAREGFAAKAIAVFKKIQKIDPSQRDVDAKLATSSRTSSAWRRWPPPPAATMPEFGMEEIGFEPEPAAARRSGAVAASELEAEPEAEPEPTPAPAPEPPPAPEPAPPPAPARAPLPPPVEDRDLIDETAEDELPLEGLPDLALDADAELPLAPRPSSAEPEIELQPSPRSSRSPRSSPPSSR